MTASHRPSGRSPGPKGSKQKHGEAVPGAAARLEHACPGLSARIAAAAILGDVLVRNHALDECFAAASPISRLGGLEARDVALARSIVTAALRRLGTIRSALAGLLEKGLPRQVPELEATLVAAAAQLLFLNVRDHAAVDLAVRATRLEPRTAPYAALVNALLRNLIRARERILAESDPLMHDTPAWLAARWRSTYGEETARAIASAHRLEPTLDLTVLADTEAWAEKLDAHILPTGSLRLITHAKVDALPGYAEGAWFVQDAAAALPARFLRAGPGMKIADLCAAPGGKTAQLAAAGAAVTAVDRSAERLKTLAANLARLNLHADVMVADAATLQTAPFDAVLLDAPCLATGTIRRHPDIAWNKRPRDLEALVAVQARLLDRAAGLVKPGGMIVYCTCSLEPEENELQIDALMRHVPDLIRVPIKASEAGGLTELVNGRGELRTLPSHLPASEPRLAGLDGFFAARLQRVR